jgi:hypothetical protein
VGLWVVLTQRVIIRPLSNLHLPACLPAAPQTPCIMHAHQPQSKQRSGQLGEALEDPSHPGGRIRLLGGRIPEKEELVAKLQVLCVRGVMCAVCVLCWRRGGRGSLPPALHHPPTDTRGCGTTNQHTAEH